MEFSIALDENYHALRVTLIFELDEPACAELLRESAVLAIENRRIDPGKDMRTSAAVCPVMLVVLCPSSYLDVFYAIKT